MQELQALVHEVKRRVQEGGWRTRYFNKPSTRQDYPRHWLFFDAGAKYKQRLFRAANRVGKTTAAGSELVMHLTGDYHEDWKGKRFDGANIWWVCGKSSETIRQILQPLLLGPVGSFGTGLIPKDKLDLDTLTEAKKSNTTVSSFRVKHSSGAFSQVEFKAYEQGRQAFEGTERSIWLDEEPPLDVYVECLTRTMTGDNILILTFTPLKGASEVVLSFSKDGNFEEGEIGVGKHVTFCTWDDVEHLSEEDKELLLASIPPYQRDARSKGIPSLGSGVIYPIPEEDYLVDNFDVPPSWKRLYGMDVGNKTAAVWLALNPDTGQGFIYSTYYKEREEPSIHAAAISGRGDWIPGAIDPAARGRSQADGQRLMDMYEDRGLHLSKAVNAVETGLYEVWEALSTGKLKIFRNGNEPLLKEMRTYARDEKGHVIKSNDHCCLVGNTLVRTEKGNFPIRDLVGKTGKVVSLNGMYQDFCNVSLTREMTKVIKVFTNEGSFVCTPDHRFMTDEGWREAKDLLGCKLVYILDSVDVVVKHVGSERSSGYSVVQRIEYLTNPEDVYCLLVPETHAFVINEGFIAANCDSLRYAWMTRDKAKVKLNTVNRVSAASPPRVW